MLPQFLWLGLAWSLAPIKQLAFLKLGELSLHIGKGQAKRTMSIKTVEQVRVFLIALFVLGCIRDKLAYKLNSPRS